MIDESHWIEHVARMKGKRDQEDAKLEAGRKRKAEYASINGQSPLEDNRGWLVGRCGTSTGLDGFCESLIKKS